LEIVPKCKMPVPMQVFPADFEGSYKSVQVFQVSSFKQQYQTDSWDSLAYNYS
jgi:hypothetical protein